ncbi:MAG: phosphate ABC transporter permease subunit PstC [Thermoplasmata archaeon]|jgi:phosphate transport system permease protein|nr:phosphate ABC transporter permease subunit PstC [Euryarchaeota archaeon]MVT35885.1 phosphate ABC transporter permease subunit PstC [Euryarchaeota archaeon]
MPHKLDKIFYFLTFLISIIPIFLVVMLFSFLLYYSIPSIKYNGLKFFTSYYWYPGQVYLPPVNINGILVPYGSSFGILLFLYGTLITSLIALIIAFPISIVVSLAVNLYVNEKFKKLIISLIELFAAIPSVLYGLWGIVYLEPLLSNFIEPAMNKYLGFMPFFSGNIYSGAGILASSIILCLMILPIMTSVINGSILNFSTSIKEGAIALGATRYEMARLIILRGIKIQIFGAAMLGLGRALGETMAVLMVSGSVFNIMPSNIYSPINTMAAALASLLDSAFMDSTGMNLYALSELGLTLMLITLAASLIGRFIVGLGIIRGFTRGEEI